MGEEGVVVQHLLEVRHEPLRIGAVARESAAELVVDAAVGHPVEGQRHHAQRGGVARAPPGPQEELERHRRRELRGTTKPAVPLVERCRKAHDGGLELRSLGVAVTGGDRELGLEVRREHARLVVDLRPPVAVGVGHGAQDAGKAGHPVAVLGRKVGPAEEGPQIRG